MKITSTEKIEQLEGELESIRNSFGSLQARLNDVRKLGDNLTAKIRQLQDREDEIILMLSALSRQIDTEGP